MRFVQCEEEKKILNKEQVQQHLCFFLPRHQVFICIVMSTVIHTLFKERLWKCNRRWFNKLLKCQTSTPVSLSVH